MSAWLWLAACFALLAAIPVAALASPIEVRASARFPRKPPAQVDVRWLFGLLDVTVPSPEEPEATLEPREREAEPESPTFEPAAEPVEEEVEPEPAPEPRPAEPEPEAPEPEVREAGVGRTERALDRTVDHMETRRDIERQVTMALAVLRTEGFVLEVTRFLRDLVGAVDVQRLGLRAGFGLGSPAETGRVYGQLTAALAWTHATERVTVDLDPDFQAEGFEGEADLALRARTWDLIRPFIVLALAEPVWNAVSNAREAR